MEKTSMVILFRAAKHPVDPYETALRQGGHVPQFVQVLHFDFVNENTLSSCLLDSSPYSGLVFTSQTAVEVARAAVSGSPGAHEQVVQRWDSLPVFVVGKSTGQAVKQFGLKPFGGSHSGDAQALSQVIIEYFGSRDDGRPLLFPCSSIRRDTLPMALKQAGIGLETVVCYNTLPCPRIHSDIHSLVEALNTGGGGEMPEIHAVFFSPSGVDFALQHLVSLCQGKAEIKFVAIGQTTAEALSNAGYPPSTTAAKPTPESLVEAINTST